MSMLLYYIFILHQTTTSSTFSFSPLVLYYIFILHQTTTIVLPPPQAKQLYYIFILHQTTTGLAAIISLAGCIISSFYIKPQLINEELTQQDVVLYLHSTSNHNQDLTKLHIVCVVLYLHSTSNHNQKKIDKQNDKVVLYLHSTSNHNFANIVFSF